MTAKKKLTTNVVLFHEGEYVTLGPDDDVPDWAKDMIGDHCYADPDADQGSEPTPASRRGSTPAK